MKTLFCLITTLLVATAYSQKMTGRLIGKWEAVGSDNQGISLEVADSSEIYVVYGEEKKKVEGFKADFSKSPAWFDFMIKDGNQVIHLKSLLHFINDDLVQWQLFDSATRPAHFTEKEGEMVYLRRKK